MDLKKYIFPIFSGSTIIGQGFVANGYFITAAHLVKDFRYCFVTINGKQHVFSNNIAPGNSLKNELYFMGDGDYYHDSTSMDIVMYRMDGIDSPLILSSYIPQKNDQLESFCYHDVMNFKLLNPQCELRMEKAVARGEEEDNYFYCDCNQFGGSSGSPLLKGNEVVGIMHGGDDKGLCAFLKAQVLLERLPYMELDNIDLDVSESDMENAWESNHSKYSYDTKRLLRGYNSIRQGTVIICNEAFYETKVKNITIPDSVKIIGCEAFAISDLESINIPNSVIIIGDGAFSISDLESIHIPNSVVKIGNDAFWHCSFLKEVVLSNSIMEIGDCVFGGCQSLEEIIIPDSVKKIGESAFLGCEMLSKIVIPESVKFIGEYAFRDCKSLSSLSLPDSIIKIEKGIFLGCDSLEKIYIPLGTKEKFTKLIPEYADLLVNQCGTIDDWIPYGEPYSLKEILDEWYPDDNLYESIDGDEAYVVEVETDSDCTALRLEIPLNDGSAIRLKLAYGDYKEGDIIPVSEIMAQELHKIGHDPIVRFYQQK